MILSLFRKNTETESVYAVYSAIVAQSRQPLFYARWSVPDTVTGRFDMISLHLALLFRRLRGGDSGQRDFAQAVFDLFFKDMDRQLREMGVTDIGVPKKIQKMGNIFYGLLAALDQALDAGDRDALVGVLTRNIFDDVETEGAAHLAGYVVALDAALAAQPIAAIRAGTLTFAAPA